MRRTAQITATARPTSRTAQRIAITRPATMPKTIFSATIATAIRTIQATRRRPKAPNAECGCSLLHAADAYPRDSTPPNARDRRPAAPEEEGGAAGRSVSIDGSQSWGCFRCAKRASPRVLARLEPQPGEPVAADELVAAAGGRDEHEAPRRGAGGLRSALRGRGWLAGSAAEVMASMIGPRAAPLRWPVVQEQQVAVLHGEPAMVRPDGAVTPAGDARRPGRAASSRSRRPAARASTRRWRCSRRAATRSTRRWRAGSWPASWSRATRAWRARA